MDYPWRCEGCGKQNMVDLLTLERRVVDRIVSVDGFVCAKCGEWVNVFYTTIFLRQALAKLEAMDIGRKDFRFHFGKTMRKAEALREKVQGSL